VGRKVKYVLNVAKAACTSQMGTAAVMLLPYTFSGRSFFVCLFVCSSTEMETVSLLSLLERNVHYKLITKPLQIVVRFVRQKFPKILKFPTKHCHILTSLSHVASIFSLIYSTIYWSQIKDRIYSSMQ